MIPSFPCRVQNGYALRLALIHKMDKSTKKMLAAELAAALRAVNLACHIGRALQASVVAGKSVVTKSDASPVTVADFAVQTVITQFLKAQLYDATSRAPGVVPVDDSEPHVSLRAAGVL